MNEQIDMKISGSSTMPGGEYNRISISGAGKIGGDVKCTELRCSGSSKVDGSVQCAGEIHSSGAARIAGSASCESLSASGSLRVQGDLDARQHLHASGSVEVGGRLTAGEVQTAGAVEAGSVHCGTYKSSGACRVHGDLEAESAVLTGAVEIGGLLNAETVDISPNYAVHISSIGGGSIRILQKDATMLLGFIRTSPGCARIGSIEGDTIELEYVEAEIVRGKYVRIGHGCRIGTVEYSENLEAEPGTVGRSTQTGAE